MITILNKVPLNGLFPVIKTVEDNEQINTQDNITPNDVKKGNLKINNELIRDFYIGDYYYYLNLPYINQSPDGKYTMKFRKGCIVELYVGDKTIEVFPSLREFAYTFNLSYSSVQSRTISQPVYWNGTMCDYKFPDRKDLDVTLGNVTDCSLSRRCSNIIMNYIKTSEATKQKNPNEDNIERYFSTNYSTPNRFEDKYALNVINRHTNKTIINCSNNDRYSFFNLLLNCFVNMILYKSEYDRQFGSTNPKYNYNWTFANKDDIWRFFDENREIPAHLVASAMQLLLHPKDSNIDGVVIGYRIAYLYLTSQHDNHENNKLVETYIDKHFNLKIRNSSHKNMYYEF